VRSAPARPTDLIVVGGGLSGAWRPRTIFLKNVGRDGPSSSILDNPRRLRRPRQAQMSSTTRGKLLAINWRTLENGGHRSVTNRYGRRNCSRGHWRRPLTGTTRTNEAKRKNLLRFRSGCAPGHFFSTERHSESIAWIVAPQDAEGGGAAPREAGFSVEYLRKRPRDLGSRQKKGIFLRLGGSEPEPPELHAGFIVGRKRKAPLGSPSAYRDYLLNVAKVDEQAYWFYSGEPIPQLLQG